MWKKFGRTSQHEKGTKKLIILPGSKNFGDLEEWKGECDRVYNTRAPKKRGGFQLTCYLVGSQPREAEGGDVEDVGHRGSKKKSKVRREKNTKTRSTRNEDRYSNKKKPS